MGPLANGWNGHRHRPGVAEGKEGKTTERWPAEREGRAKGQQIQASRSAEEPNQEVQDPAATEEADGSRVSEAGQETEPQDRGLFRLEPGPPLPEDRTVRDQRQAWMRRPQPA